MTNKYGRVKNTASEVNCSRADWKKRQTAITKCRNIYFAMKLIKLIKFMRPNHCMNNNDNEVELKGELKARFIGENQFLQN